jgi:hypothetical protein
LTLIGTGLPVPAIDSTQKPVDAATSDRTSRIRALRRGPEPVEPGMQPATERRSGAASAVPFRHRAKEAAVEPVAVRADEGAAPAAVAEERSLEPAAADGGPEAAVAQESPPRQPEDDDLEVPSFIRRRRASGNGTQRR